MIYVLYVLHTLLSIALVIVVLMQSGKGPGVSGAFGGTYASSSLFGARATATFLTRATTVLAIVFMLSCLGLTFLGLTPIGQAGKVTGEKSVLEKAKETPVAQPTQAPQGTRPPTGGQPGGQPMQVQPGQTMPVQVTPGGQAQPGKPVQMQVTPGNQAPPPPAPAKAPEAGKKFGE